MVFPDTKPRLPSSVGRDMRQSFASWFGFGVLACTAPVAKTYEPLVPGPEYSVPASVAGVPEQSTAYLADGCPDKAEPLDRWTVLDPTGLSREQRMALSYSRCAWFVTMDEVTRTVVTGRPARMPDFGLSFSPRQGRPRKVVRRPGGYLVGFNRGEWGGHLDWYALNGAYGGVLLVDNVVDILPAPPSSVVLTGLAHLGGDSGTLLELNENDGAFQIARRVSLGSAPHAAFREASGSVLVATHDGLLRVAPTLTIEHLARYTYESLYPTSIVVDDGGVIHVGMRGAVARFTPANDAYREEWLVAVTLPL